MDQREYLNKVQDIWDRAPAAEKDKFLQQRNKKFAEGEQKLKEKIEILEQYQSKSMVANPKINNIDVFSIGKNFKFDFWKLLYNFC